MFDTSLTIGDEILQQALGKGTNKHMQSIVATIQREQNEIIRHDEGRLLSCKELLVVVKRQLLPCSESPTYYINIANG